MPSRSPKPPQQPPTVRKRYGPAPQVDTARGHSSSPRGDGKSTLARAEAALPLVSIWGRWPVGISHFAFHPARRPLSPTQPAPAAPGPGAHRRGGLALPRSPTIAACLRLSELRRLLQNPVENEREGRQRLRAGRARRPPAVPPRSGASSSPCQVRPLNRPTCACSKWPLCRAAGCRPARALRHLPPAPAGLSHCPARRRRLPACPRRAS